MMSHRALLVVATMTCLLGVASQAVAQLRGIVGREAPTWRVDQWYQLPDGTESLDVKDYRGKVVYLYGFQSWCPGCHARGFPTLQELIRKFEGEDDVAFVAVQTTFEGFQTNTAAKALATAERYELKIPIGHSGSDGRRSRLMSDYRTGGTPWTVIIDRDGVVRFNDFHISPDGGERIIRGLLRESTRAEPNIKTLPKSRGGQDRIGTRFPKKEFSRWIAPAESPAQGSPDTHGPGGADETKGRGNEQRPRAILYRWWTDGCPHCQASIPAMETLRRRYSPHGLRVVGVYHPKPPRAIDDATVRAAAEKLGFYGEIAVDEDWSVLREAYLRWSDRSATSITLLIDERGVIRFVHPGPDVFPSSKPEHAQPSHDFKLLEEAIKRLLTPDNPKAPQ